jgi:hypothetical protein
LFTPLVKGSRFNAPNTHLWLHFHLLHSVFSPHSAPSVTK